MQKVRKSKFIWLFAAITVILFMIVLHRYEYITKSDHLSTPRYVYNYLNITNNSYTYMQERVHTESCLLPEEIYYGRWVASKEVTIQRKNYMDDLILSYRRSDGIDNPILRNDNKCGSNYPQKQLNQATGCDKNGINHCCNDQLGECGHHRSYCSCLEYCRDYKNLIRADTSEWIETYCPIQEYTTDHTCEFITKHFTSITFIGDSQTRHLFQAFLMHVTNDPIYASIPKAHPKREFFKGERQFVNVFYEHMVRWEETKENPKYCNKSSAKARLEFLQLQMYSHTDKVLKYMKERLLEGQSLFVFGIGLWDNFDFENVKEKYMIPIFRFFQENNDKTNKAVPIWLGANAHGTTKQAQYIFMQGNYKAVPFDAKVKEVLKAYNIPFFDNFLFTFNVVSHDGTHYGGDVNHMKTKMLVKLVRYLFDDFKCKNRNTHEILEICPNRRIKL